MSVNELGEAPSIFQILRRALMSHLKMYALAVLILISSWDQICWVDKRFFKVPVSDHTCVMSPEKTPYPIIDCRDTRKIHSRKCWVENNLN